MGKLFYVFFIAAVVAGASMSAQKPALLFNTIPIPDVIAGNNTIVQILEDAKNHIWMGTELGLVRYDGYKCILIALDSTVVASNDPIYVLSMAFDADENLWIVSRGRGVFRLAKNEMVLRSVMLPKGVNDKDLGLVRKDGLGRLWFASLSNNRILVWNPANNTSTIIHAGIESQDSGSNNIYNLAYDPALRNMWVYTAAQKVYKISEDALTISAQYPMPDSAGLKKIFKAYMAVAPDHKLWISTLGNGLFCLSPEDGSILHYKGDDPKKFPRNKYLRDLTFDRDGNIVLVVNRIGLDIFNPRTLQYSNIDLGKAPNGTLGLDMLVPECVFFTLKGDLLVGSYEGAVISYNDRLKPLLIPLESVSGTRIIKNSNVYILPYKKDKLLVSSLGQGVFEFDTKSKTFEPFVPSPLFESKYRIIPHFARFSDGVIWGASLLDGMFCVDPATNRATGFDTKSDSFQLADNSIFQITEDKSGNLWATSINTGVVKFSKHGKQRTVYSPYKYQRFKIGSNNLRPLNITCDSSNNIWVGYVYAGIGLIRSHADSVELFCVASQTGRGLPSDRIKGLFVDSKNNLWVYSYNLGVALWRNNRFVVYNKKNGLENDDVRSITEDKNGNLWIASASDIFVYAFKNDQFHIIKHIPLGRSNILNFDAGAFDDEGNYYAGGVQGISIVDKEYIHQQLTPPLTYISEIYRYGSEGFESDMKLLQQALKDSTIAPSRDCQSLFIDLSTSNLDMIPYTEYAYMLEGFNTNWITLDLGEHRMVYTNLPEGNYNLKIRSRIAQTDWGAVSVYKVVISVSFWKSIFFQRGLFAFLCLLMFLFLYNERQKRNILLSQQKLKIEKNVLEQHNVVLQSTITAKTSELITQSAEIVYQKSQFEEIKTQLSNLAKGTEIDKSHVLFKLTKLIEREVKGDDDWEKFRMHFDQANQNFSQKLLKEYPDLSQNEMKHILLIRLKLNTKEIGEILNISVYGVQKSRYRIKKRLKLVPDADLISFILQY